MSDRNTRLYIKDLRSGRNNVDPPSSLAETQCVEAVNGDWFNTTGFRKRAGVTALATTNSPFTGQIVSSIYRHVPTTDETLAEMWAVDDAATPHVGRLQGGTAWASPTLKDAPNGNGWEFSFATLNGCLYIAYQSAVDRLHCWDPVSASVRRTGLAAMGTPSAANTGSSTYAAVLRYYRTRATEQRSGVTVRRSEPSASVSFTPSGSGTAARVTQGTLPGEVETHWEVEASTDNVTFYRIATVVIGTTTYDDSAVTTTYTTNPLSASSGTYTLQRSYKYIAADQSRLLGFGMWTSTNPQSRVEYSAVLGSSDIGDVERVPINNYQALDENDSGCASAIKGPVNGSFFALKFRSAYKLTPTGNVNNPYSVLKISPTVGAVGHNAAEVGEDETGNPALYFMSFRGPYRYGTYGLEYIGKPIEDLTVGANGGSSFNLGTTHVLSHVRWYGDKRQMWMWFATGSATSGRPGAPVAAPIAALAGGSGIDDGAHLYAVTFVTASSESLAGPTVSVTTGTTAAPASAPSTAIQAGAGVDVGTHDYKITFVTASGETTPSAASNSVTATNAQVSNPTVAITWVQSAVVGATYNGSDLTFTYAYSTASSPTDYTQMTAVCPNNSSVWPGSTNPSREPTWTIPYSTNALVKYIVVFYTFTGGGGGPFTPNDGSITFANNTAGGNLVVTSPLWTSSLQSGTGNTTPTTAIQTVALSTISVGPAGVTSRKLYRRFNATGTYKLVTTIADNSTTTYTDTIANASLGAAAPSSNTAINNQVALSAIPIGSSAVVSRNIYRTVAAGSQLKLVTTIADNSTSTYTDVLADSGLGANAPTVGADTDGPNVLAVLTVGRRASLYTDSGGIPPVPDGWSQFLGGVATACCSTLFSNTVGAPMSRDLKPYIGSIGTTNTVGKCDSGTQDLGANYQAYITTKAYSPWGDDFSGSVTAGQVSAPSAAGVSLQVSTVKDYGLKVSSATVSLSPTTTETRVAPRVGSAFCDSEIMDVQFTVGDATATNTAWSFDSLSISVKRGGPVAA